MDDRTAPIAELTRAPDTAVPDVLDAFLAKIDRHIDRHLDARLAGANGAAAANAAAIAANVPAPAEQTSAYPLKRLTARVLAVEALSLEIAFELLKKVAPNDRPAVLTRAMARGKRLMQAMPQPGDAVQQKHYHDAVAHLDFYITRFAQELLTALEQEES
jgi:hypothetical protein